MSESTIKINPNMKCELVFDVTVQGLDENTTPIVRFSLSGSAGFDCTFICTKRDDGKWMASMPPLPFLTDNSVKFRVEVIVDEYYFEPASGTVYLVSDPTVTMVPNVSKPKVTSSFSVSQPDSPKQKKTIAEKATTPAYSGPPAPSNLLLTPEEEPMQGSVKNPEAEKRDQTIDHVKLTDISSSVSPGETTDPEPQASYNDADDINGLDPLDKEVGEEDSAREVAAKIIKKTVGGATKPTTAGTLFKRGADGKVVVPGLDSPADKIAKQAKAAKVRDILGKS